MDVKDYIKKNDAFFFELDNVLYPEKDYLLQVYYLFAQFIEYGEQIDAEGIIRFMEETYLKDGQTGIFEKTSEKFGLDKKYKVNFDLLRQNARLPLKLLLFAPVLEFMRDIVAAGKKLFLVTGGDPLQQLNKIKQVEWNGIEQHLIVYFAQEIAEGSVIKTLEQTILNHEINADRTVMIGEHHLDQNSAMSYKIKFLPVAKLLVS